MNQKFAQLGHALTDYPDFKDKFDGFCKRAAKLNNNQYFPNFSFAEKENGIEAEVHMFDQEFTVRFHFTEQDSKQLGVLAVYLPQQTEEEILVWHTYFDRLGNVKSAFNSPQYNYTMGETEILEIMLCEVAEEYFSIRNKKLIKE